jgi:hypothetical protein
MYTILSHACSMPCPPYILLFHYKSWNWTFSYFLNSPVSSFVFGPNIQHPLPSHPRSTLLGQCEIINLRSHKTTDRTTDLSNAQYTSSLKTGRTWATNCAQPAGLEQLSCSSYIRLSRKSAQIAYKLLAVRFLIKHILYEKVKGLKFLLSNC